MSKWTWPALAALLAIASGSYYLLSQRQQSPKASDNLDLDVEDFGDESAEGENPDNTYEMLDETPPGHPAQAGTRGPGAEGDPIKTIDDEEDLGETVKDPVVIEDDDEESIEVAKPNPKK